jgi:outer membrane protein assembly factor BamB
MSTSVVQALDIFGNPLWKVTVDGDYTSNAPPELAFLSDGTIVTTTVTVQQVYINGSMADVRTASVMGLSPANGDIMWQYVLDDEPGPSDIHPLDVVIDADGTIVTGTTSGTLVALTSPVTIQIDVNVPSLVHGPNLKWKANLGSIFTQPIIGSDGTVFVGLENGTLVALFAKNGTIAWQESIGPSENGRTIAAGALLDSAVASIAPDGGVYVAGFDGVIYAYLGKPGWRPLKLGLGSTTNSSGLGSTSNSAEGPVLGAVLGAVGSLLGVTVKVVLSHDSHQVSAQSYSPSSAL